MAETQSRKDDLDNDRRKDAHSVLVDVVGEIAGRCVRLGEQEDETELIRITESSRHHRHHQKYLLDEKIESIASDVLRPATEYLRREHNIEVVRRIEHSPDPIFESGQRYYLLINPIEGSDNFANAMRHMAFERRENRKPSVFNPQACVTLALIDKEHPFNPVATAIYHFLNSTIYSSETVVGQGGHFTTRAYLGDQESYKRKGNREGQYQLTTGRDLAFFLADYKFDFIQGITELRSGLQDHGKDKGFKVDTPGGSCASASNILQVIDGESYQGYIDGRDIFKAPRDHPIYKGGRYAKLLYTNVIAVLPIAEGFGFYVRDINGLPLRPSDNFELSIKEDDIEQGKIANQELTVVIARPNFFAPDSIFNLIDGLSKGKERAEEKWEPYLKQAT